MEPSLTAPARAEAVFRPPDFLAVYDGYASLVFRVLRRLGVPDADVDDAVQEVFLIVHRKLPEFSGRSSIKTWLHAICVKLASGWRQRAHIVRETTIDVAPTAASSGETALRNVALKEARIELDAALATLDEAKRSVFVLFELEEVPMDEVAEALGIPPSTAWARLYAARKRIAKSLRRRDWGQAQ